MSLTTPAIEFAKLKMKVMPSTVNPLLQDTFIDLPIYFNNVTNLIVESGSFTPNNNTLSLATNLSNTIAPNMVMLITDGQANLTIMSGETTLLDSNPVIKCYLNCMEQNTTYNISDIILDGTTSASTPMPQNVLVNYTLIYCQSTIS